MKKTVDAYMKMPHKIVVIPDMAEGGYTIYFPELPGCATCVEKFEDAFEMALDAKRSWLQAALEDGVDIQEPEAVEINI